MMTKTTKILAVLFITGLFFTTVTVGTDAATCVQGRGSLL